MRQIIFTLCLLFPALSTAQTNARLELRAIYKSGSERPSFGANAYITHPLKYGLSVSGWVQVEEGWAEGYMGLTYAPTKWAELSASAGIEQAKEPWRVAGSLWLGYWRLSSLTIIETGGTGPWYLSVLSIKATDWLKASAMIRRFDGFGPRVDISIPGTPLSVWAAYLLYDPETKTTDFRRIAGGLTISL